MPFASVRLEGTRIGMAANAEGMYRIEDVSAGTWTVVASMVGFVPFEQLVEVQEGGVIELNFNLETRPEAIEEMATAAISQRGPSSFPLVSSVPFKD